MSGELSLRDQMAWSEKVSRASILPRAYANSPADVAIAVNFGQSMGLSPAESLYRINVINGKPCMSAELIASQVRKAGHKLRIAKDEAKQRVKVTIIRCDDPDFPFEVVRDMAWAQGMGLLDGKNANYRRQPMTMLTWRAISACAREACPEALYGVAYTPDEMTDIDVHEEPVEVHSVEERDAPNRVKCKKVWGDSVNALLRKAGVSSSEEARHVFFELVGVDVSTGLDLTKEECDRLLGDEKATEDEVREVLAEFRKSSEQSCEVVDADVVEVSETVETSAADTKERK